jgi:GMP synthase (glutamine-hydrolysing)
VRALPEGFRTIGRTENAVAAVEDPKRKIYAVEFHPEVNHTERGTELLRNFLFKVCKAERKWSGAAFIEETTMAIREKVGNRRAICALSGRAGAAGDGRAAYKHFREHWDAKEERV